MEVSSPIIFRCQRCGDCCNDLVDWSDILGIKMGMILTPEETGLFPVDAISPLFGYGHLGNGVPKWIFLYQVSEDVCPHLSLEGSLATCTIYKKRPLACRMFPWMPSLMTNEVILAKCRGVSEEAESNKQLRVPPGLTKLMKIRSQQLIRTRENAYGKLVSQFDLGSKAWYRISRLGEARKEDFPLTKTPLTLEVTGD